MAKETKKAAAPKGGEQVKVEGFVPTLQKKYKDEIVGKLMKEFGYTSIMQVPKLVKIVINQGMGQATQDKKLVRSEERR